jgi:RecB family endonuclease NucS
VASPGGLEHPTHGFGNSFVGRGARQISADGIEYTTAVGPIDILAIDETGAFFVFELKRAASPDYAIGQLARYMGWVKQTIGKDRAVYGVVVAKPISDKLRYAVSVVPNVTLFEYEVEFHLRPAHELFADGAGARF